jgi:hypothetical protein
MDGHKLANQLLLYLDVLTIVSRNVYCGKSVKIKLFVPHGLDQKYIIWMNGFLKVK